MNAEAVITRAFNHYGLPTVFVEDYAAVNVNTGSSCFVTEWYYNGGMVTAEGFKVRKDGTRYARKCSLSVTPPANVRAALDNITN